MSTQDLIFAWLCMVALLGLIPAYIAATRGRSFPAWWLYGSLLFVVALVHSLLLPKPPEMVAEEATRAGLAKCPNCAEWIKSEARVCKHCRLPVAGSEA
jgi:hypothetical protein